MKKMAQLVKLSKPKLQGMLCRTLNGQNRVKELWILESVLSLDAANQAQATFVTENGDFNFFASVTISPSCIEADV